MTQSTFDYSLASERETTSFLTRNDRFSILLVPILTALMIGIGLIFRQQSSTETWVYESRTAGISAHYPAGWLVDEGGDHVARIRDPKARPFKTQFVIVVVAAGSQTTVRNVLDNLTIQRSADLAAYRVLRIDDVTIGGAKYTQMRFAYVDADPNPFIQRLPVVILGLDTVIRNGSRAIIVTYMADQASFEAERTSFDRFFASIRY